jgi:hypothetical protein
MQLPFGIGTGGAREALGDVVGKGEESANRASFSREFNVADFDSFGGDVTPGKFIDIASFTVPSDTEYSWGYGKASAPENQGYLYVDLQSSTPNPVEGTIRFVIESSTGRKTEVVSDFDTETLDASKTDRTLKVPFPEQVGSSIATEDARLVIKLNPKSSNTDQSVDSSESEVIIPATEYDLS